MAALCRLAGPSVALTLWTTFFLVAPLATSKVIRFNGRSLSQPTVTTTTIPFLTNMTVEELDGEWTGEFQSSSATPEGGLRDEEMCLSKRCRDAFPATFLNYSFSEGGRTLTSMSFEPAALPSPPEACQEEGLAEVGRSEKVFSLSGKVISYTRGGDMGLAGDVDSTTSGKKGEINREVNWCIKFRVFVTDAGAVKAETRMEAVFKGTMDEFEENLRTGLDLRCFTPTNKIVDDTCRNMREGPDNFVRSLLVLAEITCISGKCLDIANRG